MAIWGEEGKADRQDNSTTEVNAYFPDSYNSHVGMYYYQAAAACIAGDMYKNIVLQEKTDRQFCSMLLYIIMCTQ